MTKERATFQWKVVSEPKVFFITLGGPQAHDYSVEKHIQEGASTQSVVEWSGEVCGFFFLFSRRLVSPHQVSQEREFLRME
jgi:hypothetical protein